MSQFSYSDYTSVVARAQSGTSSSTKIGFFKLADDGDEALVRINCGSLDALEFATIHTVNVDGRWMRVSCLNPVGSYSDKCELCKMAAEEGSSVSKAGKKVYIQMVVSYKDRATGQWSAPQPVIWERPAGFSIELRALLSTYGDLRHQLVKITRNGKARDMKTTYSMLIAPSHIFKPEMIPEDFSAFNGFNISKHSYWEKTPEEIHAFVTTGAFPEVVKANSANASATLYGRSAPAKAIEAVMPTQAAEVAAPVTTSVPEAAVPAAQPEPPVTPNRNFGGSGKKFSF